VLAFLDWAATVTGERSLFIRYSSSIAALDVGDGVSGSADIGAWLRCPDPGVTPFFTSTSATLNN
jgi:hypothetical protein